MKSAAEKWCNQWAEGATISADLSSSVPASSARDFIVEDLLSESSFQRSVPDLLPRRFACTRGNELLGGHRESSCVRAQDHNKDAAPLKEVGSHAYPWRKSGTRDLKPTQEDSGIERHVNDAFDIKDRASTARATWNFEGEDSRIVIMRTTAPACKRVSQLCRKAILRGQTRSNAALCSFLWQQRTSASTSHASLELHKLTSVLSMTFVALIAGGQL
eukprot:472374-Prymnesium_polylepis.2